MALKTHEVSAKIPKNYMRVCTHAVKSQVVLLLNQTNVLYIRIIVLAGEALRIILGSVIHICFENATNKH